MLRVIVGLTSHLGSILLILRTAWEPPALRHREAEMTGGPLGAVQHGPTPVSRPLRGLSGGWEAAGAGSPFQCIRGQISHAEEHLQLQTPRWLQVPYLTSSTSDICGVTQELQQSRDTPRNEKWEWPPQVKFVSSSCRTTYFKMIS